MNIIKYGNVCIYLNIEMAQRSERGTLLMSLPAVQFRILLGVGFSEKYHVSSLLILFRCCVLVQGTQPSNA